MEIIRQSKPLYRIEYELIQSVKALRVTHQLSQEELSEQIGAFKTFVTNCEAVDQDQKYSLYHLSILMKIFKLKNVNQLFVNGIPKNEEIVIRYKKVPKTKVDGTESKLMENEVVEIVVVETEPKT